MRVFVSKSVLVLSSLVTIVACMVKSGEAWSPPAMFAAKVADAPVSSSDGMESRSIKKKVAVAGATGRTGILVVEELLNRGVEVVALVRDLEKADEVFEKKDDDGLLTVVKCDLLSKRSVKEAVKDCDAGIWCATGFSSGDTSIVERVMSLFGLAIKRTIDTVGLTLMAESLASVDEEEDGLPTIVMCSSAGVTRPSWTEEKKEALVGCADIPIVRLNPFGILDLKCSSEQQLRDTKVPYCIVRPCGLKSEESEWKSNSRPVVSQGDVAVGRIHRKDVASLLIDICLNQSDATGKTFEVFSVQNYPRPTSLSSVLQPLVPDNADGTPYIPDLPVLQATYQTLQQLLPGETQDASALAMGQTYEQLDKNEEGTFGKRGEENLQQSGVYQPSS